MEYFCLKCEHNFSSNTPRCPKCLRKTTVSNGFKKNKNLKSSKAEVTESDVNIEILKENFPVKDSKTHKFTPDFIQDLKKISPKVRKVIFSILFSLTFCFYMILQFTLSSKPVDLLILRGDVALCFISFVMLAFFVNIDYSDFFSNFKKYALLVLSLILFVTTLYFFKKGFIYFVVPLKVRSVAIPTHNWSYAMGFFTVTYIFFYVTINVIIRCIAAFKQFIVKGS
jgi:membrane-associated HD superfamily phosphohydrolase